MNTILENSNFDILTNEELSNINGGTWVYQDGDLIWIDN